MSKLLTLKEIAGELGVPESSVRKYREIFGSFIPSVGSGRSRRYRGDAVVIFKDIRELREEEHMPWDAISDRLAQKYPIDATPAVRAPQPRPSGEDEFGDARTPRPAASQPAAVQRVVPHGSAASADGSALYLKKAAALGEKQMMLVNAMAIELFRSIEDVRSDSRKQTRNMQLNMRNLVAMMLRAFGDINGEEKARLSAISVKLDELTRALKAKPPETKAPERSQQDLQRIATLEEYIKAFQKKLEQREKLVVDYKAALDASKRENAELAAYVKRRQSIEKQSEKISEIKPPPKKASFVKKIFGSK